MIGQMKTKVGEDDNKTMTLKSKSVFRSVLLFVMVTAMFVGLVSACGQSDQPTTAKGWHDLGEEHLIDKQYEQAIDAYKKVVEIEPDNIPARIGMAKAYIGLDKQDEAKTVLLEVLERAPDNNEANDMLASLSAEVKPETTDTMESKKTETSPAATSEEATTTPTEVEVNVPDPPYNYDLYPEVGDNGKVGFIDVNGDFVIEPQFENTGFFTTIGLAGAVDHSGLWGYIDETGAFVGEP